jgi:pimeloyl-ACP methyl ester carboxylesterase
MLLWLPRAAARDGALAGVCSDLLVGGEAGWLDRGMGDLASSVVTTDRLEMHVWVSGPADGVPLLLVHGNMVTGGWWRYVARHLPGDVRVIAPEQVAAVIAARLVR